MSFLDLGLVPALGTPLARKGYDQPTPIQTAAIPLVLRGGDLLARAQTGTGKTAAFGLPLIQRLMTGAARPATRAPRALVLVPTRELATQVERALASYGAPLRLRVTAIFGGVSMGGQTKELRTGTDVVVATPGRLLDHMKQRTIDLSAVEILTLDEADRMLDMGFLPPLRKVVAALPKTRQTLLFSATFSKEVVELAGQFTKDAARVDVSENVVVAPTVTHRVHPVAQERKRDLLTHVLTQAPVGQALVFCKTKRGSDRVGDDLERSGLSVGVIHGNKTQGARRRALADFKSGRVAVLVATDIAARGLDIAQLPLVVNYDLPLVAEDYIHRVGRTGRAGLAGRAVSLVSHADRPLLSDIQRLLPAPLEHVTVDGFDAGPRPLHEADAGAQFRRRGPQGQRPGGNVRRGRPQGGRPQGGRPQGERRGPAPRFGGRSQG